MTLPYLHNIAGCVKLTNKLGKLCATKSSYMPSEKK